MNQVETQQKVAEPGLVGRYRQITREVHRGFIAEWAVTIILPSSDHSCWFRRSVIRSASMEETLLIGDHVLVDKLAMALRLLFQAPPPVLGDVRRGDVIVSVSARIIYIM